MSRLWHAIDWHGPPPTNEPLRITTYAYLFGNLHTITDAKGTIYTYDYDKLNRKIRANYPTDAGGNARNETWRYDIAGNVAFYTNPAGNVNRFDYDTRNRQTHSKWDDDVGPEITTRYDAASRITRVLANSAHVGISAPDEISAETMVTFGYDEANRKIWENQTLAGYTRRVQSDLNADGRRLSLQIVAPPQVGGSGTGPFAVVHSPEMSGSGVYSLTYEYTGRNQLKSIYGENMTWAFNYTYDKNGNLAKREAVYNGVISATHSPNYDPLNRPLTWEHTSTGMASGRFAISHYQYDNANRQVATWREEDDMKGERFAYLPTNQLSRVDYNAQNVWELPTNANRIVTYTYTTDKLNRSIMTDTQVPGTPLVTNYLFSALNQYDNINGEAGSYDENFNLTREAGSDVIFEYDAANHLTRAHDVTSGVQVDFVYDGLGRCVKRTSYSGTTSTFYLYDGWKPIAEWDLWADYFQAWNVYGPGNDEILLRQQGKNGYVRFHPDPHGNVAFLLDNDGLVREQYTYDAFGKPNIADAMGAPQDFSYYDQSFLFRSREYLRELGIYDYRNRFYRPSSGRFLQIDPAGFDAGDTNLFRYCSDDPINHSDPTGENAIMDHVGNDYTWKLGIRFTNVAAPIVTQSMVAKYLKAIETGINGKYGDVTVKVTAYNDKSLLYPMNIVGIYPGRGAGLTSKDKLEEIMGLGARTSKWASEGLDGDSELMAIHEALHLLGVRDHYNRFTGVIEKGYENDIMGGPKAKPLPGETSLRVSEQNIAEMIAANGKGVAGELCPAMFIKNRTWFGQSSTRGAVYNGGRGWAPIGSAPAHIRWARNSGTGNWQADQFIKYWMMGGGPQPGEGFHPVSFDKE